MNPVPLPGQTSIFDDPSSMLAPRFSETVSRTVDPETKEQAMKKGRRHVNEEWYIAALDEVVTLCQTQATFTSDDVLIALDRTDSRTTDTRALGSVLSQAARARWCRKSGNYVPSKRPACHRRPVLVWESLIFSPSGL